MLLYCSSAMMMLFPVRRYVTCDWPKLTLLSYLPVEQARQALGTHA